MKMKKYIITVMLIIALVLAAFGSGASASAQVFTDAGAAAAYVRRLMEDRVTDIDFILEVPYEKIGDFDSDRISEVFFAFDDELYERLFVHTGIGKEGDYLKCHYTDYDLKLSVLSPDFYGQPYKFELMMAVKYKTTAEQEREVDAAVEKALRSLELEGKTEYEKIKAIYDYICKNVDYDAENLYDDTNDIKYTAYSAIVLGKAVCEGYSALFYRMALDAGLDCRVVCGLSSGEAHAWNIVRIGEKYYIIDSTWDAGSRVYRWFLKGGKNLEDHFLEDEFLTDAFTSAYPVSENDYVIAAEGCNHVWSGEKILTSATCTADGKAVKVCEKCGDSVTVTVPATGHDFGEWTQTDLVSHTRVCKNDPSHTETQDHVWDKAEGEDGALTYTCAVCGAKKTENSQIPENGQNTGAEYIPGDADGNGRLEAADARVTLRAAVGLEPLEEGSPAFLAADVDGNKILEAGDARSILRAAVGLEDLGR